MENKANKKSWFVKGFGAVDEIKNINLQTRRFFLRRGEMAEVIFVDDDPFIIREHAIWVEDDYGSQRVKYYTCCRDVEGRCPLCEAGNRAYNVGYLTILDERQFTDKEGKMHKGGKKLYGAKIQMLELLKNKKNIRGSLAKRKAIITRLDTNNAPISGSDVEILEEVKVNEEPIDYVKEFEPMSYDKLLLEYRSLRLSSKVVNDSAGVASTPIVTSDDVDF